MLEAVAAPEQVELDPPEARGKPVANTRAHCRLGRHDNAAPPTASTPCGLTLPGAGTAGWTSVSVNGDADGSVVRCNKKGVTTPVLLTFQTFKIVINTEGDADFYIDGVEQATELLAVSPSTLLCMALAIESGGASRSVDVDYWDIWVGRS